MDADRKFHLMKWAVYLGATVLFTTNVYFFYTDFIVGDDISGALNSVIFGLLGIMMIMWERNSSKEYRMQQKFNEIQQQWDDEMLLAVKFVLLNNGAFGDSRENWIAVASNITEKDPARIEQAVEGFTADLEYLHRTGNIPDEYVHDQ